MSTRGPIAKSHTAARCGPHGLASKVEPISPSDRPLPTTAPSWLPPEAQEVYRATLPALVGRAGAESVEVLCGYALAVAELRRQTGAARPNRAAIRAEHRVVLAYATALGLSPAGRARLPEPKRVDPMSEREATIASLVR
ncbi:MAG: hypothetical protein MUF27_01960 [Acidobacteria bacterium]|jgi:phage terminase small subunit|nr:hypothetical protein [Acidobacteriota bacterium]